MVGNKVNDCKNPEDRPCGLCDKLLNNLGSMADMLNGCTCPILSSSSIETMGNHYNPEFCNYLQWPTPDNLSRTEYFPEDNEDYNTTVNGVLAYNFDTDDSGIYAMVAARSSKPKHVNFVSGIYETPTSVQFQSSGEHDTTEVSCGACKQQFLRYMSVGIPTPGDMECIAPARHDDVDDYVINCWYDKKKNGIICSYEPKNTADTDSDKSSDLCDSQPETRKFVVSNLQQVDIDEPPSGNFSFEVAPKLNVYTDLSKTCSLFLGPGHSHPKLLGDVGGKIEGIAAGMWVDKGKLNCNEPDECSLNTICTETGSKKVNFQQGSREADCESCIVENSANERNEAEAMQAASKSIADNEKNERKEAKAKEADQKCIADNEANERAEAEAKKADEMCIAENERNEKREEERRGKKCKHKMKKGAESADDKIFEVARKEKRKEKSKKCVKKSEQKEREVKCAGRVCHSRVCGELCALTTGRKGEKQGNHTERKNKTDAKEAGKNGEKRDRRCNHSSVKRLQTSDDIVTKKCSCPQKTPSFKNAPTPKVSFKDCKVNRSSKSPTNCDIDSGKMEHAKRSNSSQTSHHKIKVKNCCEERSRSQIKKSLGKFIKFEGGNRPKVESKRSCLCEFVCERAKNECGRRVCCSEVKKKRSKSEMDLRSHSNSGKDGEVINKEHWVETFQMTFDTERTQLMPVKQCWSKNSRDVIEDAIKKLEDIEKKSLSGIMTPPRVCSDEEPQFYDAVDSAHMNTSESNTPKGNLTRDPSLDQKSPKNEPPDC